MDWDFESRDNDVDDPDQFTLNWKLTYFITL